ncbi:MAG: PilZ domain-containing protein [Mariprofundaceae bacterium]
MSRHENRKHARHKVNYRVEVTAREKFFTAKTETLHDISDSGISFITNEAETYQIDQRIMISITPPNQKDSATSLQGSATIVWIQHDPFTLQDGIIGIHFDDLIESEKLVDS